MVFVLDHDNLYKMFKRVSDPAFDMDAPILKDESVRDYQYYSYEAQDPNQPSRIELRVQNTSGYFLLDEAFLQVEGRIVRNDDHTYDANIQVGFVKNGIMALFRSDIYMIDGKETETIQDNVDVATTIVGLARCSDDYTRSAAPTMMFAKDNFDRPDSRPSILKLPNNRAAPAAPAAIEYLPFPNPNHNLGFTTRKSMLLGNERRFSCAIPLSHIFGFCRGVRKVIFGANHTFVLVRKDDSNDAIWRETVR